MSDSMENVKNKSKKRKRMIIALVLVIVVAAASLIARKQETSGADEGMTTVEATRMTIENNIESDGEIISSLEESVLPHTSYYLEEINVEEGEAVEEGMTILTYTNGYTMDAPYNCVVKSWSLPNEDGQITSDHYVTIAGTDVLQMELSVSDSEVLELKEGDSAAVTVDATGKTYEAEVSYISQAGDYSGGSSTFTVKVSFDNDGSLKLGMSGVAVVSLDKAENVIAVPSDAVSTKGGVSYVTLASESGGEGALTEVETGISNGSFTEIKSGLNEGDKVIMKVSSDSSDQHDGMGGMGGNMPGGPSGGRHEDGSSGGRPEGSEKGGGSPGN